MLHEADGASASPSGASNQGDENVEKLTSLVIPGEARNLNCLSPTQCELPRRGQHARSTFFHTFRAKEEKGLPYTGVGCNLLMAQDY
jgi:hypothetical protein